MPQFVNIYIIHCFCVQKILHIVELGFFNFYTFTTQTSSIHNEIHWFRYFKLPPRIFFGRFLLWVLSLLVIAIFFLRYQFSVAFANLILKYHVLHAAGVYAFVFLLVPFIIFHFVIFVYLWLSDIHSQNGPALFSCSGVWYENHHQLTNLMNNVYQRYYNWIIMLESLITRLILSSDLT